jgi:uncharacterized protein YjiS (DUF1127 family)
VKAETQKETDMTARTPRIVNPWFAPVYPINWLFGKRRATIAALNNLDDRMLEDIGLQRAETRKPQCLGDYHPAVVAITAIVKDEK